MAANEPIDPRVRLAISQWPVDAPRGAVSTFCAEHGISRKSFYELRKRAEADGPAEVLEPRTRRPRATPSKLTDEVKAQAVQVRAALEAFADVVAALSDLAAMAATPLVPCRFALTA